MNEPPQRPTLIERYRELLPVTESTPVVSLYEGFTPLHRAHRLREAAGLEPELYLKLEGVNPTGSFKDRGMTVAVSRAVEAGARGVMCASTGNTSASAAAYAARAGLSCVVVVPEAAIALGKLSQALMHGAFVLAVEGLFDDALPIVCEITATGRYTLVNSLNPDRLEGQKTAAFEICDELGDAPEFHAIPVGNGGNISAYWMGYRQYHELGRTSRRPQMLGFQAEGAAPIVLGHPVAEPQTVATAIRIGNPANWKKVEAALEESNGVIETVTDEEILEAYRLLASLEGVFCEPAGAAGVAGVLKLQRRGFFRGLGGARIVCTITGHGLKDPDTAIGTIGRPQTVPATTEAVLEAIAKHEEGKRA